VHTDIDQRSSVEGRGRGGKSRGERIVNSESVMGLIVESCGEWRRVGLWFLSACQRADIYHDNESRCHVTKQCNYLVK
jgi:hypothetical protein